MQPQFRQSILQCVFLLSLCGASPAEPAAQNAPESRTINVPGAWEDTANLNYDGIAWYRCFVRIPEDWAAKDVTLAVESIDNSHEAFVNGARVGGAGRFPPDYQNGIEFANRYVVPNEKLRPGSWNLIAIRVYDHEGRGGFKGQAPQLGTDKQHFNLQGQWQIRTGDDTGWANLAAAAEPTSAIFAKPEDGPVQRGSGGHKMATRGKPLSPADAVKSFTVPDDLEIEQVLAEPVVRQPVFLNFDERGRMWVVQYLQYPAPAGLNVVSKDVFWRAVYDKVPEPPPRGVKGLDKITIHEDTDGDGVFDKHKTFVDGLNIATACVKGRSGVWVLNPPYLLFYPDANDDDVPDGPPVVHLEGFGLEDTHSVVNSLRWGPDGWLYAAQGSTVTANVRVVAPGSGASRAALPRNSDSSPPAAEAREKTSTHSTGPGEPPVYSQGQHIWRYHPEKRIYEIFAEGGGNAFGVEIDNVGRIFSGHNGGDTRGFHYDQGAYLRKGFEKHGELSNPYAFGYFPQMDGTKGERFTHNFIIYNGGALPSRYEGKLFGVEPLQGRIVLSEITPQGSTFITRDLERVVTSDDSWFRPVDIKTGPDGAIYICDWYDRQVTHTRNQEGNLDTSNGRIYRLKKKGAKAPPLFDLGKLSSPELAAYLSHSNRWMRQTALRVLRDRSRPDDRDAINAWLRRIESTVSAPAPDPADPPAVEQFWRDRALAACLLDYFWASLAVSTNESWELESHLISASRDVRTWAVRALGDANRVSPEVSRKLKAMADPGINVGKNAGGVKVRAQLACTAKRLPAADALPIVANLLRHDEDANDPRLPLLCWWAVESKCESDRDAVVKLFGDSPLWSEPMVEQHILERLMRRYATAGTRADLLTCAKLLQLSPSHGHSVKLMKGFEEAFKGRSLAGLPADLIQAMARHNVGSEAFRLRQGDPEAITEALRIIADSGANKEKRLQFIDILGEVKQPTSVPVLLRVVATEKDGVLRKAALTALLSYDDGMIGSVVASNYPSFSNDVRAAAQTLLTSRANWSLQLIEAVDAGQIKPADVPPDIVRRIKQHKGEKLAQLAARHWPQTSSPTTAEMQMKIQRVGEVIRAGNGDPYSGQKLFNTACASCHTLFARGGKVGPDLTAYQRGDLDTMLLHIVNPNAEIREGYENMLLETKDERSLNGFLVERDANVVVLRGPDGQNLTIEQKDIAEMRAAGLSLMPEGLLDPLSDQQVRDLFAYLRSTQPLAN